MIIKILNIINFLLMNIKNRTRFFIVYLYFKNNLKKLIKEKNKKIFIIFDNKTNNPTYADFLFFPYLARFFVLKGFKVHFIIFDEINKEWQKNLNFNEIKKFQNEQIDLIKKIGKIKKKNIHITSYKKFKKKKFLNSEIIFKKQIFKSIKIFDMLLDLLNIVLSYENKKFLKKFLLNKKQFKKPLTISKLGPYISWHIRYNERWGNYNNTKKEIASIANKLKLSFKNKKIAIISDESGCKFAKKSIIDKKRIFFSKDITSNFYEDVILLLNSEYYFQFKAGGFLHVATFSSLPYTTLCHPSPFNLPWSKEKYFSWILNTQHRVYKNFLRKNLISKLILRDGRNFN